MIKARYLVLLSSLLLTQLVYGNTVVMPPEGPFVSFLKVSYVVDPKNEVVKGTLEIEEIEYKFEVPDLGRYSERTPNVIENNVPFFNVTNPNVINNQPLRSSQPQINPSRQENLFDQLPLEKQSHQASVSPYDPPNANPFNDRKTVNQNFDSMPIAQPQNNENTFYPPEWSQPNPLRPLNRAPQANSNNNFNNSNNSMMGMPFPSQMAPWIPGNQTNNGY